MPDIFGINYNGVKPRPTYEEFINFVDYPVKFLDRSASFARDLPLLTQLEGAGMMESEELERREIIERHKADMIRLTATDTGTSAHLLRALSRRTFNAPTESSVYS